MMSYSDRASSYEGEKETQRGERNTWVASESVEIIRKTMSEVKTTVEN